MSSTDGQRVEVELSSTNTSSSQRSLVGERLKCKYGIEGLGHCTGLGEGGTEVRIVSTSKIKVDRREKRRPVTRREESL